MRKAICFLFVCCLFADWASGRPLKRGTPVLARLVTSADSNRESEIQAEVVADVVVDGEPVILQGTPIRLFVNRRRSKGVGKPGYLQIGCISTTTVDGQQILLSGTIEREGYSREGAAIGLGVGLGLTFLPIGGFFFLCLKGEKAEFPAGTPFFNVTVVQNYKIEP